MSSILKQSEIVNQCNPEERRTLKQRLNGVSGHIGEREAFFEEDERVCPYATNGRCEGVKDPEGPGRCLANDFSYARCELYYSISRNGG